MRTKNTTQNSSSISEARNLRRVSKLSRLYDIKGDGVAQVRIESLTSSDSFKASVKKLSEANLTKQAK